MNLKEAFRYQNAIVAWMEEGGMLLSEQENILKVRTTHFRSQVMPEAEDVVIDEYTDSLYAGKANAMVAFLGKLLEEKAKLTAAIHQAKSALPIDMDGEIAMNQQRQRLASILRNMTHYQSSEKLLRNGGTGYRFNEEGNQVSYCCDAKQVTTIDFDRHRVRRMATQLSQQADAMSTQLDACMVDTQVDYTPVFDVNEPFATLLADFIESSV